MSKKKIPALKINPASVSFSKTQAWNTLQTGLQEIHSFSNSQLSFEELYRASYNLVLNKHGNWLYTQVENNLKQELLKVKAGDTIEILKIWDEYTLKLSLIRDILMYLDRSFVPHAKLPLVYDMGQGLFKEIILLDTQTANILVAFFLENVEQDRLGRKVEYPTLKKITEMYFSYIDQDSNTYFTVLEGKFLENSRLFYRNEADSLLQEGVSTYLNRVMGRMEEERKRMLLYMKNDSLEKVLIIIDQEMLIEQMDWIINSSTGLGAMVKTKSKKDLGLMYSLLSRVENGVLRLSKAFCDDLRLKVNKVHESVLGHKTSSAFMVWIDSLLEIKKDTEDLIMNCFCKDKIITSQSMNTFKVMINQNVKACEFTSLYIDLLLKKGLKGRNEEEIEESLDAIMGIFRFLDEKDVFDRYYKQHLAKRLLTGKSIGEEIETSMISKFKLECGHQFTTKLEGMFNDIRISAELVRMFNDKSGKENIAHLPSINISVLTSTFWPMATPKEFALVVFPDEVRGIMERFEQFYHSRHSGRKLTWLSNTGSADLRIQFSKGKKEINMSVLSMIILLTCFKDPNSGSVTFQTILDMTKIPYSDLVRNLQALSLCKYRILIKSTTEKTISSSDTFTFNSDFQSSLTKIKILGISGSGGPVEDDNERSKTMEKVEEARKHQIEAAIVRIMKARQTMEHSNLVAEVISQLSTHFSPSPIMVKKRIEGLIEREYMDRDKQDIRKYVYVA